MLTDGESAAPSPVLREMATWSGLGEVITVRAAKAHLSGLLDLVAEGRKVIITSNGKPKARLMPMDASMDQKPFQGTREHLRKMPKWRDGPTAEEIVRTDRDGRGW